MSAFKDFLKADTPTTRSAVERRMANIAVSGGARMRDEVCELVLRVLLRGPSTIPAADWIIATSNRWLHSQLRPGEWGRLLLHLIFASPRSAHDLVCCVAWVCNTAIRVSSSSTPGILMRHLPFALTCCNVAAAQAAFDGLETHTTPPSWTDWFDSAFHEAASHTNIRVMRWLVALWWTRRRPISGQVFRRHVRGARPKTTTMLLFSRLAHVSSTFPKVMSCEYRDEFRRRAVTAAFAANAVSCAFSTVTVCCTLLLARRRAFRTAFFTSIDG